MAGRSNKNPDGTWDRTPTTTSAFGTNGRITHDSTSYYERAINPGEIAPETGEEQPVPSGVLNSLIHHSSEVMTELPDRSVHLLVTSPPYTRGYIMRPRDTKQVRSELADWTEEELVAADRTVYRVIADILDEKFWPPADAKSGFYSEFAAICQDEVFDREVLS